MGMASLDKCYTIHSTFLEIHCWQKKNNFLSL